jgi:hypothetical protein
MRYQKVRVMQAKLNLSLCHQSFHPTIRRTKRGYIWPIAKKKPSLNMRVGFFKITNTFQVFAKYLSNQTQIIWTFVSNIGNDNLIF